MTQPLPRLAWLRTQADFAVPTATAAGVLATLVTEFTNAGYTVEQHTVSGVLTAIGITFPEASISDLRVLIAGRSTAETPTMLTPDTYTANFLMIGLVKGVTSETIVDWEAASPYGGATVFSGYWRIHTEVITSATRLFVLCSDEAFALSIGNSAANYSNIAAGAIIDPHSENAASCETSGRVYGMTFCVSTTLWSSTSIFLSHVNTANNGGHTGAWLPRTSTWTTLRRSPVNAPNPVTVTTSLQTPGATESVCVPVYVESLTSPYPVYGRAREIFFWHDDNGSKTINKAGPTVAGYTMSARTDAANDAIFFAAADNRA